MSGFQASLVTVGTHAQWNSTTVPIPSGVIIITLDGYIKIGDGLKLYAALPTLHDPSTSGGGIGSEELAGILRLATDEETELGADDTIAVSPKNLNILLSAFLEFDRPMNLEAGFYYHPSVQTSADGVFRPDFVERNVIHHTLTQTTSIVGPTTMPPGGMAIMYIQQGSTPYAVTFDSNYVIKSGTVTSTANGLSTAFCTFLPNGKISVTIE